MSDTGDTQDVKPTVASEAGQDAADDGAQDARGDDFGSALREGRERAGLSVAEVANALKVAERTVRRS